MSYATIPVFNQTRRLYWESHMKYMVSSLDRPKNTPIYSSHSDLDSFILYNENDIGEQVNENDKDLGPPEQSNISSNEEHIIQNSSSPEQQHSGKHELETLWNMSFDGSYVKAGLGAGVWIHNTNEGHSYKLDFQCTNNITEYEALLLGLHFLKELGAKKISTQGDLELIINNIKGEYSKKNPRLREYKNSALDLLKTFDKYQLTFIPRAQKCVANELAFVASNWKIPHAIEEYNVKVKNRPTMLDNINHWQVFEVMNKLMTFCNLGMNLH